MLAAPEQERPMDLPFYARTFALELAESLRRNLGEDWTGCTGAPVFREHGAVFQLTVPGGPTADVTVSAVEMVSGTVMANRAGLALPDAGPEEFARAVAGQLPNVRLLPKGEAPWTPSSFRPLPQVEQPFVGDYAAALRRALDDLEMFDVSVRVGAVSLPQPIHAGTSRETGFVLRRRGEGAFDLYAGLRRTHSYRVEADLEGGLLPPVVYQDVHRSLASTADELVDRLRECPALSAAASPAPRRGVGMFAPLHEQDDGAEEWSVFDDALREALESAGLAGNVSVWTSPGGRPGRVEIEDFSATPMRQGHGTRAMEMIVRLADEQGVLLKLRIAHEGDDGVLRGEDDPDRPPDPDELVAFYERFGFQVAGGIDEILMVRTPGPAPEPEAAPRGP